MPRRLVQYSQSILMAWVGAACVVGCKSNGPHPRPTGPTEPLAVIVNRINANNQQLPTLFARHEIEANIVDQGKTRFFNANGTLFVRKPRELLLKGKKLIDDVFEMGSTDDAYWFTVYADENTRWWGHYRNVGKSCSKDIPIRPDLIGEVLSITDINTNLSELPAPTVRFNNDLDAYMIEWHNKLPDRFITEREVWYDRATLMPRKVVLYDPHGRPVLRANLSGHQPVELEGVAREKWPRMATYYDLLFPQTGSKMTMRLSDLALRSGTGHPREGTIRFRDDPEVVKVIQLDEACE
jgi:hypothetical protein